jgi:hypothetical protein
MHARVTNGEKGGIFLSSFLLIFLQEYFEIEFHGAHGVTVIGLVLDTKGRVGDQGKRNLRQLELVQY